MNEKSLPIHTLNATGITQFREYLQRYADGYTGNLPDDLLTSSNTSKPITGAPEVTFHHFEKKIDAAQYLSPRIERLDYDNKYFAVGLWSWLSAFYFDTLCRADKSGKRVIGPEYFYIPKARLSQFSNYHRHLLAFPVRMYTSHGDMPKIFLEETIHRNNTYINELGFRQDMAMNYGVLEAANLLYWDKEKQEFRPGSRSSHDHPGSVYRYVTLISQLGLTYDLFSMSGSQIIRLLPQDEFGKWLVESTA